MIHVRRSTYTLHLFQITKPSTAIQSKDMWTEKIRLTAQTLGQNYPESLLQELPQVLP